MRAQPVASARSSEPALDPLEDGPAASGGPHHHAPIWVHDDTRAAAILAVPSHPAFERLLARMPLNVRQSLTPEQLSALARATLPVVTRHPLDYRISLPFFGRRYYLTILGGRERRNRDRLLREGQLALSRATAAYSLGLGVLTALAVLAAVLALYVAKTLLGIDLMADQSALHDMMSNWP